MLPSMFRRRPSLPGPKFLLYFPSRHLLFATHYSLQPGIFSFPI